MRDIRSDLQERAKLVGEQINNAQAKLQEVIQQYKQEHESRIGDLKSELEAVHTLMGIENRRLSASSSPKAPLSGQHAQQPQQREAQEPREAEKPQAQQPQEPKTQPQWEEPQPRQRLAEFLVRRVCELGPESKDDLTRLAMQEGYFSNRESAEPGTHATLIHVMEAGLIRQLPNGKFAAPTLLNRLRQAV